MRWVRLVIAAAIFIGPVSHSPAAEPYLQEELRVPFALAGPRGLEALLVRPNEPGRYPLALITHGAPRSIDQHASMSPLAMLPQAIEFARRGWAAAVVMRRGYGDSGGDWADGYGYCGNPNYIAAATAGAADLKAAIAFLVRRPDIDPSRVISVGVSAGGFATVALTADPPPELVAAISFAGGRGSMHHNDQVCHPDRLIEAFGLFGQRSRIPMLWVYAENDHYFGPKLAQQLKAAFTGGGGDVEFVAAPAFGRDGHRLFSMAGIPVWSGAGRCVPARARSEASCDAATAPRAAGTCRAGDFVDERPQRVRNLSDESPAQGVRHLSWRSLRLAIRPENDGSGVERSA